MIDKVEPGALFGGLRAAVTVADEAYRIVFMNDLAVEHYAKWGGAALIGADLLACHNAKSQAAIRALYARCQAGDLAPSRYRKDKGEGRSQADVFIPIVIEGQFRGVAELIWNERSDLVYER